jgi:diacylglycerol kinase family enzyme
MTRATRELKDQLGWLAYPYAALVELRDPERARVRIELDGETLETDAYAIVVANVGRMGRGGARFPGAVDPFDGLADVFILRHVEIGALAEVTARLLPFAANEDEPESARDDDDPLWHARAKRVRIETPDTDLPYHVDGDPRGTTPLTIEVAPGALPIVLPPS